ncbi:MAG TPA: Neelaredoxin [Thermoflexia bacterium]|jgi:superoxide reductase|nr:Neelaredoxin [Thermoflexia bacterium]
MRIGEKIQSADWKAEKHVPVIEAPERVEAGKPFQVTVTVGKEIPHPNTIEHHIRWIDVYFQPEGDKFVYQVAHFDFTVHGEGTAYAHPTATFSMQVEKPGTLIALSLCNIHGLWESGREITV